MFGRLSRPVELVEAIQVSYPHQPVKMGKVHGSLARAGKVKSQTPKVEKQEKKKAVKGRAKKRAQYISRFVNVTLTPGGKRSMNQQPAGKSG
ncbi:hypothetical protein CcaverHIS002_0109500 [Cutaneotrichosporon cavernicola]|uniref:40S ribosomal protein S30 n=1 Tax=Cutaneotrichosporon cavernicola TaxID=279322 RepID=A0AA48HZ54_9TREE|nr:uncharacterized protein CcaverHIS019_0109420 [Cutaneotrichosporon cavernicola]BEI80421.1 hypothetical protein CcaverHIS002_0109500 [Cutaneotrichosporon cavernicola]BEI88224.1 hypothetical protein CcaverHIS019_0109420 [Cutaneotrichosporon cavernicola]